MKHLIVIILNIIYTCLAQPIANMAPWNGGVSYSNFRGYGYRPWGWGGYYGYGYSYPYYGYLFRREFLTYIT